ncbi:MAG: Protease HtpX [Chlamydiae bacterium]|nr:Protease HtpX [Chlamydiota bacterium]
MLINFATNLINDYRKERAYRGYSTIVPEVERAEKIQKKVNELKKKMNVSIPVTVMTGTEWAASNSPAPGEQAEIYFPALPMEEIPTTSDCETAILAHELAHLKFDHSSKQYLYSLLKKIMPIIFSLVASTLIIDHFFPTEFANLKFFAKANAIALFFIVVFKDKQHHRVNEVEADTEALKYLNRKEKLARMEDLKAHQLKARQQQNWLDEKIGKFFGTHPSDKSRIEQIQKNIDSSQ